jgi:hypothetical protein
MPTNGAVVSIASDEIRTIGTGSVSPFSWIEPRSS